MTSTLVTILGRAPKGYTETTYRLPDDTLDRTAFFGLALARHLKPDEIVILGTAGSMWSVLVENLAEESGDEDARVKLMEAEEAENVDQALLDDVAPLMKRATGAVVVPTLIPKAENASEQHEILKAVDGAVARDADLHFDLTHGLRPLGVVGFLSSFMLERLRGLKVLGLWYGAFDMKRDDVAPVLRLDGLLRVRRWLDALDRFEHTGDYGVFAPLLREDGVPDNRATHLETAAFLERTLNVQGAARELETFLPVLDQPLRGASLMFQDRLAACLRWTKAGKLSEQQRKLAFRYLSRRDFVRAAIFGKEACVSEACEKRHKSSTTLEFSWKDREKAETELERELKEERGRRGAAYWSLTHVRNALAHGVRPPEYIEDALKTPQRPRRHSKVRLRVSSTATLRVAPLHRTMWNCRRCARASGDVRERRRRRAST